MTPQQLENLKKGKPFQVGEERARICGKKGKIASEESKAEKKAKALEREEVVAILTQVFNAPVIDEKTIRQLEAYNLPKNMLTKTLFNAVQKAGINSNMLRVLLELINALNQQQTNINVNNTPIIIGGENDLQD